MSGEIIRSDAMWLRMTDLEYKDLTEEEYKQEIKRIYAEEYGEKLPADVNIFPSSKAPDLKRDDSGYQGTAVHFQSEEQSIDEVYVISQGTDDAQDWEYNNNAMLAGQDAAQARATNKFTENAKKFLK